MLGLFGWRIEGTFPDVPKFVLIVAPSNLTPLMLVRSFDAGEQQNVVNLAVLEGVDVVYIARFATKRILAINPNLLIFVEGTAVYPKDGASWTSKLRRQRSSPRSAGSSASRSSESESKTTRLGLTRSTVSKMVWVVLVSSTSDG